MDRDLYCLILDLSFLLPVSLPTPFKILGGDPELSTTDLQPQSPPANGLVIVLTIMSVSNKQMFIVNPLILPSKNIQSWVETEEERIFLIYSVSPPPYS